MKDLVLMHYFLNMHVYQSDNEIFIYQNKYTDDMLKKFSMDNYKLVATPIAHGDLLCKEDGSKKVNWEFDVSYKMKIGYCSCYFTCIKVYE